MMRSLIPDRFWNTVFAVSVTAAGAALAYSLYRQHANARVAFAAEWEIINAPRKTHKPSAVINALQTVLHGINSDLRTKQGTSILSAHDNVKGILQHIHIEKDVDGSSGAISAVAVQLVMIAFLKERQSRSLFAKEGGYGLLLQLCARAHGANDVRVVDITAQALKEATEVDEKELVMPGDVPEGCEGSLQLAAQPLFPKILRTLQLRARFNFLNNMTAMAANVALLRTGADALSRGIDNLRGMDVMLTLLDGDKLAIKTNCIRGISFLVYHISADVDYLLQDANLTRIVAVIRTVQDGTVLNHALKIIERILDSGFKQSLVQAALRTNLLSALLAVWISDVPAIDRSMRKRAEKIVSDFAKSGEDGAEAVGQLRDNNAAAIYNRLSKDQQEDMAKREDEHKKMMAAQQYMQQMIAGGQIPPHMAEEMMGMDDG